MAEDRLKHSATITIDREQLKNNRLKLTIKNTGAGHYLPTGLTDLRQMWIEIIVDNEKGQTIYSSGRLDKDNYLPEGAIIFNTVFGDGKGNPTLNISKAREILRDKRIPPLQSLSETVELPEGDWKQLTATARLLYRSAPQKILDMASGKGRFALPVVTMAETRERMDIK